ncbi:MAG: undecaprenyl-phosphate glucose phosphotransferase [Candidatus Dadabacteria bacterium]|nr:MAG: undecaprenyl-phosphate glucose phosphotransferase [Candidatus Dadabacteria bacterium]
MLKQRSQLFEVLFIAADLFVVSVAWCLAYWLRFKTDLIPVSKGVPSFHNYLSLLLFIWLIWAFVFKRMGLYRPMRGVRTRREIWLLINANMLAVVFFIAATYLFREKSVPFSRLVFVYFGFLATIGTVAQRSLLRYILREIRRRGYNLRYLLIVGAGQLAGDVASRIRKRRELGIQVIGCLSRDGTQKKGPRGIPVVGKYEDLEKILSDLDVDQLVVALPLEDNHFLPEIMSQIGDSLVDVKIIPDLHGFTTLGNAIEEFEGLPVITLRSSPLEGINFVAKRALDIVISTLSIILLSPLFLLIALLIKCTSRGPVFYVQERVSLDGSPFKIFKFRTMYLDSEKDGPGWTKPGDSRITPVGRFLRATSLDELPQLFNVLKGDMSIVGPRPERPVFIREFRKRIPRYMLRHKVPAGMTGWAQVNGWRGDTSIEKRIEHDLYYIENWSVFLDLKILFLTLFRGFINRNAY